MEYKKEDFLNWLTNTYDIEFVDRFGIVDKFFEWLKSEGEKNPEDANVETKDEDNTVHFTETIDENGRVWYEMCHFLSQPDEARHLKPGDAIVYKETMRGVETTGFMIIKGFDFASDFAGTAFIGKLPYALKDDKRIMYTYYDSFSPSYERFSLATEDEIEQFMGEFKENSHEYEKLRNCYLERCKESEELKKYVKYFE